MSSEKWKIENIDKVKKYRLDWYYRNKESVLKYKRLRKKSSRLWFKELKKELKCNRCDESHPACIEFHHRDPNKKETSFKKAIDNGWSRARILKEVSKCEPLCANCHKKEHFAKFFMD
jgi:hypothetical protein